MMTQTKHNREFTKLKLSLHLRVKYFLLRFPEERKIEYDYTAISFKIPHEIRSDEETDSAMK